ncbi:MAG: hypothetical protein GWN58_11145, partial [Anaerolineae bacterium]|nr:hypothetical protein [Anaerolineae bacterium]
MVGLGAEAFHHSLNAAAQSEAQAGSVQGHVILFSRIQQSVSAVEIRILCFEEVTQVAVQD